ncbi:hypothetical protein AgCh_031415 [Apium graveolens]
MAIYGTRNLSAFVLVVQSGGKFFNMTGIDWSGGKFFSRAYLGVKAVIAKSYERIHRINLVGMGIIPLCFKTVQDGDTLGLTRNERFTTDLPSKVSEMKPGQDDTVTTDTDKSFICTARFDI